jgi:hypothetical protein
MENFKTNISAVMANFFGVPSALLKGRPRLLKSYALRTFGLYLESRAYTENPFSKIAFVRPYSPESM